MTVTLKRRKTYLGIYPNGIGPVWKFPPRFSSFNAICEVVGYQYLDRRLSYTESVNIQAMLGANSISEMKVGSDPRKRYSYKLVRNHSTRSN